MARAGRKPKYQRQELRERMLEAGFDQLRERGVFEGLNSLRLDAAIVRAEVPRAAAYKEFESQDNFRMEVLEYILAQLPLSQGLAATAAEAEVQLGLRAKELTSSDPEVVRAARADAIRVVCELNFGMLDGSVDWRIYRSIVAASQTDPNLPEEIRQAVSAGETALVQAYAVFFEDVATRTGLQLRPEFKSTEFAMAVYAVNDGLANRPNQTYRRTMIKRDYPVPDSSWTLFAISFEALVEKFFEPTGS